MMLLQKILNNTVVNSFARLREAGIACQHTFRRAGSSLAPNPAGVEDHHRDESRQEVTTVENMTFRRPSALPAACAQVSGVQHAPAAADLAHVSVVGVPAVRRELTIGTSQIQAQWVEAQPAGDMEINVPTVYGLAVQGSATVKPTVGDVRGVPPRGRPV